MSTKYPTLLPLNHPSVFHQRSNSNPYNSKIQAPTLRYTCCVCVCVYVCVCPIQESQPFLSILAPLAQTPEPRARVAALARGLSRSCQDHLLRPA